MATRFARSGEIGLADLVEAMAILRPSGEASKRLANSLGFGWRNVQAETVGVSEAGPLLHEASTPTDTMSESRAGRPAPIDLQPLRAANQSFELAPGGTTATVDTGLLAAVSSAAATPKPPYQPLFRDQWWRALAHAMLATPTAIKEIDMRIVSKHLGTGRPVDALPWRVKNTLRRGVVLVLDRSESMQPFWRDQWELLQRCRRVMGDAEVRAHCVETDEWSATGPTLRWSRPEPESLAARVPVVIVSDFEMGREMTPRWPLLAPWRPLIDRVRAAGAPLIALIPMARSLWPAALGVELPSAVVWDNDTSISAVRNATCRHG